jgi:NADH:ubiquinone oxidoreductase subunit F (NADH-binding)
MTQNATLPPPGQGRQADEDAPLPMTNRWRDSHPGVLPRLMPAPGSAPVDLAAHLERFGAPPYRGAPRRLIGEVEAAGLTGRGGAAFPTHRKLAAMATGRGPAPVVVGNGAEGEPASSKDKSLLWFSPHLVLDGLQLAAEAVGSVTVGLYVHRNLRLYGSLEAAIAERAAAGVDAAQVELIEAPPRFLAGEESALASRASGGSAAAALQATPRLTARGGGPAHAGPERRDAGAPGPHRPLWRRVVPLGRHPGRAREHAGHAVSGRRPDGVVETTPGTPIADLLRLPAQAVLVGGYHGAWLPGAHAQRLPLTNAALRPLGAAVGAGVLAALPGDRCGIAETARVARYLALESAGQCGPCFNGLPRMAGALEELARPGPDPRARADLERWSGLVVGRGACHHPDGTARLVRSALGVFADEMGHHARGHCTGTSGRPFLPLPAEAPLDDADWS